MKNWKIPSCHNSSKTVEAETKSIFVEST